MKIFAFLAYFVRKMKAHRTDAYSAQIAFFVLFSVMPLSILILTCISFFPVSTDEIMNVFEHILPSAMQGLFREIFDGLLEQGSSVMASFSAIAVIWSASKSVYYLIGGFNSVFEVRESRSIFKVRALSVIYILLFVIMMTFTLFVIVLSSSVATALALHNENLSQIIDIVRSLRFTIGLLLLTILFCLMYKALPNRKTKFIMQLPGAVVSAVGWILFSALFSFYAEHYANYTRIYGSLTTIVVFMLWMYFSVYILFFGAELNLLIEKAEQYVSE